MNRVFGKGYDYTRPYRGHDYFVKKISDDFTTLDAIGWSAGFKIKQNDILVFNNSEGGHAVYFVESIKYNKPQVKDMWDATLKYGKLVCSKTEYAEVTKIVEAI